jgi:hypothetical protein
MVDDLRRSDRSRQAPAALQQYEIDCLPADPLNAAAVNRVSRVRFHSAPSRARAELLTGGELERIQLLSQQLNTESGVGNVPYGDSVC